MTPTALFTLSRQFHEDDRLVAVVSTPWGQAAVWSAATLLLFFYDRATAALIAPLLALIMGSPTHRHLILSLGGVYVFYQAVVERQRIDPGWEADGWYAPLLAMALIGGGLYGCYRATRSYKRLPRLVRRHPLLILHAIVWMVFVSLLAIPRHGHLMATSIWLAAACFPFLIWRCGYMLLSGQRRRATDSRFREHFFYLWPAYGGTDVPYGKGYDYLQQTVAETMTDRARAQLAGLKLLILAWMWQGVLWAINGFVHGLPVDGIPSELSGYHLDVPRLSALIGGQAPLHSSPAWAWASLFVELITRTLKLAIAGHVIIGCLRLFGFHVFRNTYRPLLSQSVVEFWNRFYYYFKELLVEFFFFPTYASYFKTRPKLRLFAATMAAAFLGNVYYHVLRDIGHLAAAGLAGAWSLLFPRVFYSLLLALGIYVSFLRERKRRGQTWSQNGPWAIFLRIKRIAGVWLFYALIHIWNADPPRLTFAQRTDFFLSLFGIR